MWDLSNIFSGIDALVGWMRKHWRPTALGAGTALLLLASTQFIPQTWAGLWALPHAVNVVWGTIGAVLIVSALLLKTTLKLREHLEEKNLGAVIATAWLMVACMVFLIIAGTWWFMGAPRIVFPTELEPRQLGAIITRAFAIVTGLGAVAFLVIAYRRQHTTENGEQRENTKLFTERFTTAVGQLGDAQPAVRLGGVHALAHLADEAPAGREDLVQMVIDVLCAYLRIPFQTAPTPLPEQTTPQQEAEHRKNTLEYEAFREVRHAIVRVIGNRLRERGDSRWRGKDYDFSGVDFDGGDFHGAHFTGGRLSFRRAGFTGGIVDLNDVRFRGAVVDFTHARFVGAGVEFNGAQISSGQVDFSHALFQEGVVSFSGMRVLGGEAIFAHSKFEGIEVNFTHVSINGGRMLFNYAWFESGEVTFDAATIAAGMLGFTRAKFKGAYVTFNAARFEGGEAKFAPLVFGDPNVDFTGVVLSGSRVTFVEVHENRNSTTWAAGPAPMGIVKAAREAPLNTTPLPLKWYGKPFQGSPAATAEGNDPNSGNEDGNGP
ncbi:pentapeptide repeat-containing protein [Nocardiopsis changdeensis]|uniref:Pentapeptide repeat-containing protein n=1 Tax=Nocardiopsis changdeensis TaxID=2831969 RepID=A0ABX8BQ16_9ACTN|nr:MULTISPECIES: pentapeptide repeat-containing protein [Nocardiopsis]QUX24174.1 pentapeptide repeat-containing protein [Nocardiopsis changdeensis]QYX34568.1 pentapeptide repeat-containing protein [Nocardiopsis sp. MT53]